MRLNISRVLIGLVIVWNLQAALVFLLWPDRYTTAYELQDHAGAAVLRGIGVLFVMWNVPYVVALWHPVRQRVSLYEALAMQTIGLVGELVIYLSLPTTFAILRGSIYRFIIFDGLGFLLLLIAAWITRESQPG
jgi:hypothetical protein